MSITLDLNSAAILETLSAEERKRMLSYYTKQTQRNVGEQLIESALYNGPSNIEKSFVTVFKDIDLLAKTLEEHGCQDVKIESENSLSCFFDNYVASFKRENEDEPFMLTIACNHTFDLEGKVEDLTSEYTMNAQESTYFTIKEKINEKNYKIESEEVFDDNTIILTIDIN